MHTLGDLYAFDAHRLHDRFDTQSFGQEEHRPPSNGSKCTVIDPTRSLNAFIHAISECEAAVTFELRPVAILYPIRHALELGHFPRNAALFEFSARQGRLSHANVTFSKPINVTAAITIAVRSLTYDFHEGSVVVNGSMKCSISHSSESWQSNVFPFLLIDDHLASTLSGRPWPAPATATEIQNGQSFTPRSIRIITRVRPNPPSDSNGVPIALGFGAELCTGSPKARCGFYMKLGAAGRATLVSFSYEPEDGNATYELLSLECPSISGLIQTTDAVLDVNSGASFQCDRIYMASSSGEQHFCVLGGRLDCELNRGSRFLIGPQSSRSSRIVLDGRSSLKATRLSYLVKGEACTLAIGPGSHGTFTVFDGGLAMSDRSQLRVDRGMFVARRFTGIWGDGDGIGVSADIERLDLRIAGGCIQLTESMDPLSLSDGHIVGKDLFLTSQHVPTLTGQLTSFTLTLADDSTFHIPGGMWFSGTHEGTITALNGLQLGSSSTPLQGVVLVQTPFSRLANHEYATFVLTDGRLTMPISIEPSGILRTPPAKNNPAAETLTTIADATFYGRALDEGQIKATVNMSRGKLFADPTLHTFTFDASWAGQIRELTFHPSGHEVALGGEAHGYVRACVEHLSGSSAGFWDRPISFRGSVVSTNISLIVPCLVRETNSSSSLLLQGHRPREDAHEGCDDKTSTVDLDSRVDFKSNTLRLSMRPTKAPRNGHDWGDQPIRHIPID